MYPLLLNNILRKGQRPDTGACVSALLVDENSFGSVGQKKKRADFLLIYHNPS